MTHTVVMETVIKACNDLPGLSHTPPGGSRRLITAWTALSLALFLTGAQAAPALAAAVGKDGIPILWDTAWQLSLASQAEIDIYLQTRASQGFDGIFFGVWNWEGNVPLGNGQKPFLADRVIVSG